MPRSRTCCNRSTVTRSTTPVHVDHRVEAGTTTTRQPPPRPSDSSASAWPAWPRHSANSSSCPPERLCFEWRLGLLAEREPPSGQTAGHGHGYARSTRAACLPEKPSTPPPHAASTRDRSVRWPTGAWIQHVLDAVLPSGTGKTRAHLRARPSCQPTAPHGAPPAAGPGRRHILDLAQTVAKTQLLPIDDRGLIHLGTLVRCDLLAVPDNHPVSTPCPSPPGHRSITGDPTLPNPIPKCPVPKAHRITSKGRSGHECKAKECTASPATKGHGPPAS